MEHVPPCAQALYRLPSCTCRAPPVLALTHVHCSTHAWPLKQIHSQAAVQQQGPEVEDSRTLVSCSPVSSQHGRKFIAANTLRSSGLAAACSMAQMSCRATSRPFSSAHTESFVTFTIQTSYCDTFPAAPAWRLFAASPRCPVAPCPGPCRGRTAQPTHSLMPSLRIPTRSLGAPQQDFDG